MRVYVLRQDDPEGEGIAELVFLIEHNLLDHLRDSLPHLERGAVVRIWTAEMSRDVYEGAAETRRWWPDADW